LLNYRPSLMIVPKHDTLANREKVRPSRMIQSDWSDKAKSAYKKFYEEQGTLYGNDHLTKEYPRIQFVLSNLRPTDRVLEIGCQTGGITRFIAEAGGRVVAVEVSSNYIERAKKNVAGDNVDWRCQFGEDLTYTDEFDVVVLMEVVEHVLDPKLILDVAYSALKLGGKLLCTVPDEDYEDTLGEHRHQFSEQQFGDLLYRFSDIFTFHKKINEKDGWYFAIATK
jgi:2-polyprenyl-3-methyl-5-hydroxy-6-metoxy-1,4-benzoquinol methylase